MVLRTQQEVTINGKTLPKGSFIVRNNEVLKNILSTLTTQPIVLDHKPNVPTKAVQLPKIALLVTWFHDMDAGWTRYIFDTYHIPFTLLRPEDVAQTNLSDYDYLIFPDQSKPVILDGKYSESGYYQPNYPPQYTKGIGKKGLQKIMEYVDGGGKVLSWGRSTDLFLGMLTIQDSKGEKENFVLPYRNIHSRLNKQGLYCPGTLIKTNWKPDHPLTLGMKKQTGIFYRGNPVLETQIPGFDMDRRVIGWFPEKNLIMSGYAEHINLIGNKVAMVWLKKGKGQMVLYGFSPIFRASTPVTYKLVFNALML